MKQSSLFPQTIKKPPKGAQSINHKLLVRAGFIDQLMTGSWTLLPLGQRVVTKINQIIREEMNAIGAQEVLMPLLHPKTIWNETGRWDSAREVMYQFQDTRGKEYALSFTHEEIFLDLIRKHLKSYQDLPIALYHFSTKFRAELRARSGILRGREFLMKDLYSVHATEKDFWIFYDKVKNAYLTSFTRMGFDTLVVEAAGGVFTDNNTHEFQVIAEDGEDTIYYCDSCKYAQNQEIHKNHKDDSCPLCKKGKIKKSNSIEIGNIFPFGTYYSEKMNITYINKQGKEKHVWFGSYGIGSTRVMGAAVEVNNDDAGIIWPTSIAPFAVHLIELPGAKDVQSVYNTLVDQSIEVLWDDRDLSAGRKFADADLIGIPVRLVVSSQTGDKIEFKLRSQKETSLLTLDQVLAKPWPLP